MSEASGLICRYPDESADQLVEALAKLNAVNRNQILLGDGSGEILKLCAGRVYGTGNKWRQKWIGRTWQTNRG
jgi:histidinol-phosphate/aromatic aminotransferase/cobyric acid decarboxylase-like protein